MRIIYFYQYFSTPSGSWGTRVYDFAKEWVEKGHQVTVVTSVYSKSDLHPTQFVERQKVDGIDLIVLKINIDNRQRILKRIWTFVQYSLVSSWFALTEKYDVVIASSGPITIGIPGLVGKILRRKPFVFEVRDLWPEGAIEMGIIKSAVIKWLAFKFEKLCYQQSNLIVTLSKGMESNVLSRFPGNKVISVTNAANLELFGTPKPFPKDAKGILPKRYAIYTGNIGEVNNSFWLVDAAEIIKNKGIENLQILLVGQGQLKAAIKERVEELGLQSHLLLWDLMPKEDLVAFVQHAMVSLVPLKNKPVLNTSSPNKFFESLAAGVPVIQNTTGWMRTFLEAHHVGYTLHANDPLTLANLLIEMAANPETVAEMGVHAKEVAAVHFDKKVLADKMLVGIENCVAQ
jgi:glycosyltransferase involved in cell wall biosynthesis